MRQKSNLKRDPTWSWRSRISWSLLNTLASNFVLASCSRKSNSLAFSTCNLESRNVNWIYLRKTLQVTCICLSAYVVIQLIQWSRIQVINESYACIYFHLISCPFFTPEQISRVDHLKLVSISRYSITNANRYMYISKTTDAKIMILTYRHNLKKIFQSSQRRSHFQVTSGRLK